MGKNIQKVGGQAVLEGVMMRAGDHMAIAVRNLQGEISVETEEIASWGKRWPILKLPLLRGAAGMIESMKIGAKALHFSAVVLGEEEEGGESSWLSTLMMGLGFVLAMGLFVALPSVATRFLAPEGLASWQLSVIEGLMKVFIFLAYLVSISRLKDIRRVFEYHGAEHKSIYNYEMEKALEVENAKTCTRFHPRCGTSFLLLVMFISILVFSIVDFIFPVPDNKFLLIVYKIFTRIPFVPVVAGISFEIQRWTSYHLNNIIGKMIAGPGLLLQKITTKEPDESQLEVALVALKVALGQEVTNAVEVEN